VKINKEKLAVELDEIMTNVTMEDIATSLPESAPRYIAYLYHLIFIFFLIDCLHSQICFVRFEHHCRAEYEWPDGRKSYPLLCIFYCPYVVSPALGTMYASTKTLVMNVLQIMKVYSLSLLQILIIVFLSSHSM
jgi:hypothetical protein